MATPTKKQKVEKVEKVEKVISSAMMGMSNDIIAEILTWLPAKSLVRFKWLGKYWFDLITKDDDFIKIHLLRSNLGTSSRLWPLDHTMFSLTIEGHFAQRYIDYTTGISSRPVMVPYPLIRSHSPGRIFSPCHGLILCSSLIPNNADEPDNTTKLCILNPCTKQYKEIPSAPCEEGFYGYHHYSGLDYRDYGFGYDRTTDDYNVIRVIKGSLGNGYFLHVYTLRTNSWRIIDAGSGPLIGYGRWSVNGDHIYWINDLKAKIVCFDIGKERYEEITNQPECFHDNLKNDATLDMFEGSLSVILHIDDPVAEMNYVEMWVMKDNYNNNESSWTKLFRTAPSLECSFVYLKPLIFTKSGEIVLMNEQRSLLSYDSKNPTTLMAFKRTLGKEMCDVGVVVQNIVVYRESLVSLNFGTCAVEKQNKL